MIEIPICPECCTQLALPKLAQPNTFKGNTKECIMLLELEAWKMCTSAKNVALT